MRNTFISIATASAFVLASIAPAGAFMPRPPHHFPHHFHHHHHKPVAAKAGGSHGGMGYAGYIPFCAATGLIISGVVVGHTQHRELTTDEALGILGTCIFPPLALLYLAQQPKP